MSLDFHIDCKPTSLIRPLMMFRTPDPRLNSLARRPETLLTRNSKPETRNSSPPFQFISQHIKVISMRWLDQIERRVALSNHDAIEDLQRESDLAIQGQRHLFFVG